ncbi:hypothetical protein L1887_38871 [Cichorium endivia]|nr:hypothetical protein L1887_38871 [Cichorium endivia]
MARCGHNGTLELWTRMGRMISNYQHTDKNTPAGLLILRMPSCLLQTSYVAQSSSAMSSSDPIPSTCLFIATSTLQPILAVPTFSLSPYNSRVSSLHPCLRTTP